MDITYNVEINANPNTVFNAVATQKGIANWWSKESKVGEQLGEKSELRFDKQGTIVDMAFRTDVLESDKKVVWTCIANPNPAWLETKLIYDIVEKNGGVSLSFAHADFEDKWEGQQPFEMTKEGWKHFMNSLKTYCEGGVGQPW